MGVYFPFVPQQEPVSDIEAALSRLSLHQVTKNAIGKFHIQIVSYKLLNFDFQDDDAGAQKKKHKKKKPAKEITNKAGATTSGKLDENKDLVVIDKLKTEKGEPVTIKDEDIFEIKDKRKEEKMEVDEQENNTTDKNENGEIESDKDEKVKDEDKDAPDEDKEAGEMESDLEEGEVSDSSQSEESSSSESSLEEGTYSTACTVYGGHSYGKMLNPDRVIIHVTDILNPFNYVKLDFNLKINISLVPMPLLLLDFKYFQILIQFIID